MAILDSAYALLKSRPVAAISTVHIARRAGVSTATVYRWWRSKEALLLEASMNKAGREIVLGSTGSPLERLRDYAFKVGRLFTGKHGIVTARLLTAIQDNDVLRQEFVEKFYLPQKRELWAIVKKAIEERQLPPQTEVTFFLDSIFGPMLMRLLLHHEEIDKGFVASAFDHAVAGTSAMSTTTKKRKSEAF